MCYKHNSNGNLTFRTGLNEQVESDIGILHVPPKVKVEYILEKIFNNFFCEKPHEYDFLSSLL